MRHPLRLRARGHDRDDGQREGEHPKLRLDAAVAAGDLVLCCALVSEERAARRAGACTALVGLGAGLPIPEGRLVSFGVAGSLVPGLGPGTLVTASRAVDAAGRVVWEGEPLGVSRARQVVVADVGRVVDDPGEREALARATGAEVVDMETAALAATGRLVGVLRAIIDTPDERVGRLGLAARPDGRPDWPAVVRAFAAEPVTSLRVARRARRAFASLEHGARQLRPGPV